MFLFRRRLAIAGVAACWSRSRRCSARFVYLQVVAARPLPHARRDQPHRDRADRAQPRRDHRPQRRRARAELLGVHARDPAVARARPRRHDRRARARSSTSQPRDRKRFRKLLDESKNFESLPLRTRLTDEEVARFAVNRYRFPGVEIKARLFRKYPFGEVASHVVGYIGRINDRDLAKIADVGRDAPTTRAPTTSARSASSSPTSASCTARPASRRSRSTPAGRAVRTLSRTPPVSGNNLRAVDRHQAAGRWPRPRSATAAARWSRSSRRPATCSRSCQQAGLRPEPVRRRHRPGELGGAERIARQAAAQPAAARRLSAGLDDQAVPRARRADVGQAHAARRRSPIPGYFQLAGAAHRFRDDKPGGHGMVDMYKSIVVSCDTYYYLLASDTDIDDTHRFMSTAGLRPQDRHRHRGRAAGHAAVARMEAAALRRREVPRGAPQVVPRRLDLRRHRPGLQRVHADAARARDRDDRQRRRRVPAAPRQAHRGREDRRGAHRSSASRRTRSRSSPSTWRSSATRSSASTRKARARRAFRGATYTSGGKTGTAQVYLAQGREVQGAQGRRAAARPRVVHRLRAGRQAARSRSRCWSRTAASARRPRRRSRARCSTTTCSARRRSGPAPMSTAPLPDATTSD